METFEKKSLRQFYLLEYFYILLKSVENYSDKEKVFESFKLLKQKYLLGESKYKRLISIDDEDNITPTQISRYKYTFEQVVRQSLEYNLIRKDDDKRLYLKEEGKRILKIYEEQGVYEFNKVIFKFSDRDSREMQCLINLCYEKDTKNGLLVFPIYTPRKIGMERSELKTTGDIIRYSHKLQNVLESDIKRYLKEKHDLSYYRHELIEKLKSEKSKSNKSESDYYIPKKEYENFDDKKYNAIMKKFRDFWLNVFLKNIYKSDYSFTSFDFWTYRAKQVGIIHVTEFYPTISGRVVYPTAVILKSTESQDFEKIFEYNDGSCLYIHRPIWNEKTQEEFVKALTSAYYDMKEIQKGYFVNLADVRELVCYKMRISEYIFDEFLEKAYKLNISGGLKIKISLEADRLPHETKAMYLKRSPVMIDNKYCNIIAIDITRKGVTL